MTVELRQCRHRRRDARLRRDDRPPDPVDPRVKGHDHGLQRAAAVVPRPIRPTWPSCAARASAVVESGGLLKVVPPADAKLQASTVSVGECRRGERSSPGLLGSTTRTRTTWSPVLRPLISPTTPSTPTPATTRWSSPTTPRTWRASARSSPRSTSRQRPMEVIDPLQHRWPATWCSWSAPGRRRRHRGAGAASGATAPCGPTAHQRADRAPEPGARGRLGARHRCSTARCGPGGVRCTRVVHLKNADAAALATVLRAAFAAGPAAAPAASATAVDAAQTGSVGEHAGGLAVHHGRHQTRRQHAGDHAGDARASPSTGGFIQADPATNSLIITAPEPLYRQDARHDRPARPAPRAGLPSRAIVEVSGGERGRSSVGGRQLEAATTRSTPCTNPGHRRQSSSSSGVGGTPAVVTASNGLTGNSVRMNSAAREVAGRRAAAAADAGATNVVSAPNLITLDNEEAKIVGARTCPSSPASSPTPAPAPTNPFQTIERKDVGITLRIRPQIGETRHRCMTIYQEQSGEDTTAAGTSNPGRRPAKRSIEEHGGGRRRPDPGAGRLIEDTYSRR